MKKIVIVITLVNLYFFSNAQIYKTGDLLNLYTDIIPDTLINFGSGMTSTNESYYFDFNNDLINDLELNAYFSHALGGNTAYIKLVPLNTNLFMRYGRTDSVYNPLYNFWLISQVAKPLLCSDTINSLTAKWKNINLYLTNYSGSGGFYSNVNDWVSTNNFFIGIKYVTTLDTNYGWIKVNCSGSKCLVKDYSSTFFNASSVYEIKESENALLISPNPATDAMYIQSTQQTFIKETPILYDIKGQKVSCEFMYINSHTYKTDVSDIAQGVYFVFVQTNNGYLRKKVIINR